MEITARKIENAVGIIFPNDISPQAGEVFIVLQVGDSYILKPKKKDVFQNLKDWEGFRDSLTIEDKEWDSMAQISIRVEEELKRNLLRS